MIYSLKSYHDEVMYSHFARLSDNTLSSRIINKIFNANKITATIDLPNHLNSIYENFYSEFESSVLDVINKYTLFPFYESFLTTIKKNKVVHGMKGHNGSRIHINAGINSSKIPRYKYPRYCPQCIIDSKALFQEAYWLRIHQIPNMVVCPIHNVYIKEYQPTIKELNQYLFIPAERISKDAIKKSIENKNNKTLLICTILQDILFGKISFDINSIDYKSLLINSQFMKGSIINYIYLIDEMYKFYGQEALHQILSISNYSLKWIPSVVRQPTRTFEPIKHILLFNFLTNQIQKVELYKTDDWAGPWPCMNGTCNNYGNNKINNAFIFYDNTLKRTAAIVKCTCGCQYKISYQLKNGVKKTSVTIKEYGDLWNEKVDYLYSTGTPITRIANSLKTSFSVISRYIKSKEPQKQNISELKHQNLKIKKREEWINLLNKYDYAKVVNAQKANYKLYKWLFNNDRSWLTITNKLNRTDRKSNELKLDWNKIDSQLLNDISEALDKIKNQNFTKRVTVSLITKLINKEKNYIKVNEQKLPQSLKLIKESVETVEENQKKRIIISINELAKKGTTITASKVVKNANIKRLVSPDLSIFLTNEILNYERRLIG